MGVEKLEIDQLRVAAIRFLNPAPLMWDFEHPPLAAALTKRFQLEWMLPSACADYLAHGRAEIGLLPIAALPHNPELRILPGCVIAAKQRVRSLLFVHRANQTVQEIRTVAADMASRSTLAYARILLNRWNNPSAAYVPMRGDLDAMLHRADAAVLIGDPALLAYENRAKRTGEKLVYLDLAEEWRKITSLPMITAVWGVGLAGGSLSVENIAEDFIASRDHGLQNIDTIVQEWSQRVALSPESIRSYLTENIHYKLDEECVEGMRAFFRLAAEHKVLPPYEGSLEGLI